MNHLSAYDYFAFCVYFIIVCGNGYWVDQQHCEKAYDHLLSNQDREVFKLVDKFNPYDLYFKSLRLVLVSELKRFYENLIAKYFSATVKL